MSEIYEAIKSIPGGIVTFCVTLAIILMAIFFVRYNELVLKKIGKLNQKIVKRVTGTVSSRMKGANRKFKRSAELNYTSLRFGIYRYFDEIVVNTGLHREGVTVFGLLSFITVLSLLLTIVCTILLDLQWLALPTMGAFFFLFLIIFRYNSVTRVEKNEAQIMDAIDFLVSDVKSGITNSIIRYKDSFHEDIRPFFLEFIDNVNNNGYTFRAAMEVLADQLGYNFSDFAQKAILYDEKGGDGMEKIFNSVIEEHRQRRILRHKNKIEFQTLKVSLLISFGIIVLYVGFTLFTEPFIQNFITNSILGRLMIIADVLLVAFVMSYITNIRAKAI